MSSVTTAQMAIYIVLIIPVLYLLVKHGKAGILGWFYFAAFCSLRILGGALALGGSSSANIIANIGLSPLLLAVSGILHESNTLRRSADPKLEWALVLAYHILIAGATAILAIGASALQSSSPAPGSLEKIKAGIAIFTVGWSILVGWAGWSWFRRCGNPVVAACRAGQQLLISVLAASVFIGIRIFYTLAAFVSQNPSLSPADGTVAVRVVLILLPELFASLTLLAYGWVTRNTRLSETTGDSKNDFRLRDEAAHGTTRQRNAGV